MRDALGMSGVSGEWSKSELDSFLIEITQNVLAYKDSTDMGHD